MLRNRAWPAAAVVAALAAPASIALAARAPAPDEHLVSPSLRAPLAGHQTAAGAMRDAGRDRLAREHVRLSRRYDALSGHHTAGLAQRRALTLAPRRLSALNRELRAQVRELDVPVPPVLRRVAQCESHGDPKAIGGGGSFRGAFQFMTSTWQSVGGRGDPAAAPLEEQYRRAAILMARSGSSPWPVCGA